MSPIRSHPPDRATDVDAPSSRSLDAQSSRNLFLGIALLVLFCSAYMHQVPSRCPTPLSRLDLLHSLLHGTVKIDAFHVNTPDKSEFKGHFYSDKAPGTVALIFPAFAAGALALKAAGDSMDSERGWLLSSWIACVGSLGILTALGAAFLFAWLTNYVSRKHALLTTLALFLGAAPLPYATMMFSHSFVVALLVIAIWALDQGAGFGLRSRRSGGVLRVEAQVRTVKSKMQFSSIALRHSYFPFRSSTRLLLAGFACGLALASEYTAGLIVVGLFLWSMAMARFHSGARMPPSAGSYLSAVISRLRSRLCRMLPFCLAALPPLLLIPLYSWLCFRNVFILPYSLNVSFPEMKHGLYAIKWPDAEIAFNLLFTPSRGLFFWTPFLVIAGIGYWHLIQVDRRKFWLMYGVPLLQIIVISGRSWDWPAGPSLGPRYLAPILPLLALPCALGLQRFPRLGAFLGAYSIIITTLATLTNASPPSGYYDDPLLELNFPLLLNGDLTPNLGLMLGLSPWLSVTVFYGLLIAATAWLWREAGREVISQP
jgi:MFS family permease